MKIKMTPKKLPQFEIGEAYSLIDHPGVVCIYARTAPDVELMISLDSGNRWEDFPPNREDWVHIPDVTLVIDK